jgi:hypothetical protein
MKLECRIGVINPGLDIGPLSGLTEFIEKHFLAGSHNEIALTCIGPKMIDNPLPSNDPVSALELHNALAYLTGNSINPASGPISRIGVLLAHSYAPFEKALGVMFDRGFTTEDDPNDVSLFTGVPREGCAVFLAAISTLRSAADQYLKEVLFTAVHELGHVFNLQHETNSLNFMKPSQDSTPYGPPAYNFTPDQQDWLSQCSTNPNVRPGGSPFMDTGIYGNLDMPVRPLSASGPFGLELVIDCQPREFWQFEPVQLEIELRQIGGPTPGWMVADELDPGYRRFRLMIEDPIGERRLYRSTRHFCGAGHMRKVETNMPFRRDLPVFGQAGGYTFRRPGIHRLWVEFETEVGILCSNILDVFVKPEYGPDSLRKHARHHLSHPRVATVLFHREDLSDGKGLRALAGYIDRFPKSPSAAEIYYTLGRASLARAARVRKNVTVLHRKAADHLKRALDHEQLGLHRCQRAQGILDSLPRTTRHSVHKGETS